MAVGYRAGASNNEANPSSSFTITIPGTVQTDDVLYVSFHTNSGASATVVDDDTGGNTWTDLGDVINNNNQVHRKVATSGTASKTITVATNVGSTRLCGLLDVYSGVDTSSPNDAIAPESNASGDETSTGITPSVAGCFIHASIFSTGNDIVATSVA
jgi:hypothetical protein